MSSFFPTAFEKIWKFLLQPSFFPGHPVFVSPFLKKIWIFCSYSVSYQEDAIFFSWLKKSWLFSWITIFRSSCGSHIVHMQKIRNRSNFFQKIFHIRYIAKNFESVQALSGILPKILKTVPLFWKNLPHRVYFQNFWNRYRFSGLFFKNLSLADRVSPFQQYPMRQFAKFAKTTLYRGYFQNLSRLRCCFPKKSEKNITSTPLTIKIPPLFCHTPFQLFSKKTSALLSGLFPKHPTVVLLISEKSLKNHCPSPLIVRKSRAKRYTPSALFSKKFVLPLLYITFFP